MYTCYYESQYHRSTQKFKRFFLFHEDYQHCLHLKDTQRGHAYVISHESV